MAHDQPQVTALSLRICTFMGSGGSKSTGMSKTQSSDLDVASTDGQTTRPEAAAPQTSRESTRQFEVPGESIAHNKLSRMKSLPKRLQTAGPASARSALRKNVQALVERMMNAASTQSHDLSLQRMSRQRSFASTSRPRGSSQISSSLHKLVQDGDAAGIAKFHGASSAVDWQRALCSRDGDDLTPLALACHLGSVEIASKLLSFGAAVSIFVCGFMSGEFLCTLPFARVVPESHVSKTGREIAEQHVRRFDSSDKEFMQHEELRACIDSHLAEHIKQLANGSIVPPVEPEKVETMDKSTAENSSAEMSTGDIVRLRSGVFRSSILISQHGADNTIAADACLGKCTQNRLGLIIHVTGHAMVVASLSSGHVCEYAPSDLVFADGSSIETESLQTYHDLSCMKCPAGHVMKIRKSSPNWKCDKCLQSFAMSERLRCQECDYDLCNMCQLANGQTSDPLCVDDTIFRVGDTVTFSPGVNGSAGIDASSGMPAAMPTPTVGMRVKTTSDKEGAPRGKSTLSFNKGQTMEIVKLHEEGGKWYALGKDYKTLWFPLSSTDWKKRAGTSAKATGGCCIVRKTTFSAGLKVVRGPGLSTYVVYTSSAVSKSGPVARTLVSVCQTDLNECADWRWGEQDGGAGVPGVLKKIDKDGWAVTFCDFCSPASFCWSNGM